jgi:orotate phosphoribosyltransferase
VNKDTVLDIFRKTGVMLNGHFLLTSGKHSDRYMQCAKLFEYPDISEKFCSEIAEEFKEAGINLVIGPALGGVIMSFDVARLMKVRNIFAERENGAMTIRRGFEIPRDAKVLVVEDVITTGGSVQEVVNLVKEAGATVCGVAVIVDRSAGKADFGCKLYSCIQMDIQAYPPDDCPVCAKGLPLVKPGSRKTL